MKVLINLVTALGLYLAADLAISYEIEGFGLHPATCTIAGAFFIAANVYIHKLLKG